MERNRKESFVLLKSIGVLKVFRFQLEGFSNLRAFRFFTIIFENPAEWVKDSLRLLISSWVCNVDTGMLSNKVNWKNHYLLFVSQANRLHFLRY